MKQSRLASLLESWGNTLIGFAGALLIQNGINWWYGLPLKALDNLAIIGVFTLWSLARNYGWRRLMERLRVVRPLTPFEQAVIAEVHRQVDAEGFDAAHDDAHMPGELGKAGAAYLMNAGCGELIDPPGCWPWHEQWWKPKDVRRDLVRGCALGLAEGNKFERARKSKKFAAGGVLPARFPAAAQLPRAGEVLKRRAP